VVESIADLVALTDLPIVRELDPPGVAELTFVGRRE